MNIDCLCSECYFAHNGVSSPRGRNHLRTMTDSEQVDSVPSTLFIPCLDYSQILSVVDSVPPTTSLCKQGVETSVCSTMTEHPLMLADRHFTTQVISSECAECPCVCAGAQVQRMGEARGLDHRWEQAVKVWPARSPQNPRVCSAFWESTSNVHPLSGVSSRLYIAVRPTDLHRSGTPSEQVPEWQSTQRGMRHE